MSRPTLGSVAHSLPTLFLILGLLGISDIEFAWATEILTHQPPDAHAANYQKREQHSANEEGHGAERSGDQTNHQHSKASIKHGTGPSADPNSPFDHHGLPIRDDLIHQKVTQNGVVVEFTAENFLGVGGRGGEIAGEIFGGEHAVMKFKISDAANGAAITDIRPAVWMDLTDKGNGVPNTEQYSCQDKVHSYLSGNLATRPDIDLNSYFLLAMNTEATISVIDPMIDIAGMTNLFAVMDLSAPGADWAITRDQEKLFVTTPAAGKVDVADLESFRVVARIDAGENPQRIALRPDMRQLWVANDAVGQSNSGVTVIDPVSFGVLAKIPTGSGRHEVAFSADGRRVFVTNATGGTVSVIDTDLLKKLKDVAIGERPVALALSELTKAIYVADARSGQIVVLDDETLEETARIVAAPGLAALRFAPGGRWGVASNTPRDEVYIIDGATNRVAYKVPVKGGPDQIAFSENAVYIRSSKHPSITTISLADLGAADGPLPVVTVPVGQRAPELSPHQAARNSIFANTDDKAVLIANPADDQVYYYAEGAQAPLGSFQGHKLYPGAVQIVDRSLREVAPGLHFGRVRIPRSGTYDVAFLLDSPKVLHCFQLTVKESLRPLVGQASATPSIEFVDQIGKVKVGEPFTLRFKLTNSATKLPMPGLNDLHALVIRTAGNWHRRTAARPLGDGFYEISLRLPKAGLYNVFFGIASLNLSYDQLANIHLQAMTTAKGN